MRVFPILLSIRFENSSYYRTAGPYLGSYLGPIFLSWAALVSHRLQSVTGVAAETLSRMQQLHAVCHERSITSMRQLGMEGACWEKIRNIQHLGVREHPDLEKALKALGARMFPKATKAQKAVNPKRL